MNVIEFNSGNKPIAFCFIDNTSQYESAWSCELIKNISDYTISNLVSKGYTIYQSEDEDSALLTACEKEYEYAVVFFTGTEFINGTDFFEEIEKLINTDFYIYGHLLDRGDAYYELHHQCYLINLNRYRSLGSPIIGKIKLGDAHQQVEPNRSLENIHDDYTPVWVNAGNHLKTYNHKLHGWNIISQILNAGGSIYAFNEKVRASKKHYYPENHNEFLKHIAWAYGRQTYCSTEFVHTRNTETIIHKEQEYEQIITPASGQWFINYISKSKPVTVVYYDYNQQSLDYWRKNAPTINNVTYKFVKIDLLGLYDIDCLISNLNKKTLINLSNIFCYEGTAMFASLEYRLKKEKELLNAIPKDWTVLVSTYSTLGFTTNHKDTKMTNLTKPTWHYGRDWNE